MLFATGLHDFDEGRRKMIIDQDKKNMRDTDVLFALILMVASIALIIYSLVISFEAMRVTDCAFYIAPGLPTLLIGFFLLVSAMILLVTARRQGGDLRWLSPKKFLVKFKSKEFWNTVIVFGYLFLYMIVLWERTPLLGIHIPFWLATFIFLNLMMITFKATKFLNIIIISGITTFLVDFFFRTLARIPLS